MAQEVKEFQYEYNPIKETKGGIEASKVIWSTKSLEMAVDAINQGLPLKANPFCGTNTKLLKPDLVYKRTEEEIEDIIKCMKDPIHFANKCYMHTPEGLKQVTMRDYQEDYLRHLQNNRFSIFLSCRQSGKCFTLDSKIKITIPYNINSLSIYKEVYKDKIIYNVPVYELYNIYCKRSFIWNLKYNLYKRCKNKFVKNIISFIDYIDYNIIRRKKLIDNYKTIEEIDISDKNIQVLTDTGFEKLTHLTITKPFKIYNIELENGYILECADEHRFFNKDMNEVYVKDINIGDLLQTDIGLSKVSNISINNNKVSMCDVSVDSENHRLYTNGILSHNSTTTAVYCLWNILFNPDKNALILSKSAAAGQDLLKKIKDMYMYLPYYIKPGTFKWNQTSISFDNNSTISTEAFSQTAGLGKTINMLILDEFAWCPPNEVELFYNNIIPTVTTISDSNVCIMSTQNGFNLFYKLWKNAIEKKSMYAPFKVDWWQVPQYNDKTKQWDKRTEKWHQEMVGILGSEEAFQYQYGTQFSASDKCIISREALKRIRDNSIVFEKRLDDYIISLQYRDCLYIKPDYDVSKFKNNFYIVTVDIAEGGGADSTVFNIFELIIENNDYDHPVFEQVAYWKSNNVDIEHATLDFWLLVNQMFNENRLIISIEWNTYGALFYNYIMNYNEDGYAPESAWRYKYGKDIDYSTIARYKKGNVEENIAGFRNFKNSKTIPGVRWSGETKKTACALAKMLLEFNEIRITDVVTIGELENFEQTSGGSYKAAYGHDDIMMTIVQIPFLKQTLKFKEFLEDIKEGNIVNSNNLQYGENMYDIF